MKKTYLAYSLLIILGIIGLIFWESDFIFPSKSGIMVNIYVGILQTGVLGFIFDLISISNKKREIKLNRKKFLIPIIDKINLFQNSLEKDYSTISSIIAEQTERNIQKWESISESYDKLFILIESFTESEINIVIPFWEKQSEILKEIIALSHKITGEESAKMLFELNSIFTISEIAILEKYETAIEEYLDNLTPINKEKLKNSFSKMNALSDAILILK